MILAPRVYDHQNFLARSQTIAEFGSGLDLSDINHGAQAAGSSEPVIHSNSDDRGVMERGPSGPGPQQVCTTGKIDIFGKHF